MTKGITLGLFFIGVVVIVYLNRPISGHEQELKKLEQTYKHRIDSIRTRYRELIKEDSVTFQHYADAKLEAARARNESDIWKRRYNNEKNNNRHFSNADTDSLLQSIR